MSHHLTVGARVGLLKLPPIPLCCISGLEFGCDQSKKRLGSAADRFLRDLQAGSGLLNLDTGWVLRINKFRVKLTAKTYAYGLTGNQVLHALSAVEIENAPLGTLPVHDIPEEPKPQAQPTTGRTINISDLLHGARCNDGSLMMPGGETDGGLACRLG